MWMEARSSRAADDVQNAAHITSWVQGMLIRMDLKQPSPTEMFELPARPTVNAYLDKYCRDNPSLSVMFGSVVLDNELKRGR